MAQEKVKPNTTVLTVAAKGGTEKLIVCLTQTGFNASRNAIDAASFCGDDSLPGTFSFELPFTGQRMKSPDAANISEKGLFDFIQNATLIEWTLGPVTPVEGDVIYTGDGYLNTFNTDNGLNSVPTMTGTINAIASTVVCTETPVE